MKASYFGHVECIVALLMDGANIHYENEFNGKTALHYAAEGNQPKAVIRLLEVRRICSRGFQLVPVSNSPHPRVLGTFTRSLERILTVRPTDISSHH